RDAEVAAATADRPEQVGVVGFRRGDDATVGEHDLGRCEVVDGHAVLAHQPAEATTEGETGDARSRDHAAGGRETVHRGGAVVLLPRHAGLCAHAPRPGVDVDPAHRREVDHEAAVGDREAGDVVPAAAHRDLESGVATEVDRVAHVGRVVTTRDDRG